MDIYLHSYSFRDYPLEDAFRSARENGYDGVELHGIHCDESILDTELLRCRDIAVRSDVHIRCFDFTGDFICADDHAREESVSQVERSVRICAQDGVALLNGFTGFLSVDDVDYGRNGSALATEVHYDRATEALKHLGAVAAECGVTLTIEIHMNTIHDTVASMVKLLDRVGSDHVLANPDPGNMFSTSTAEKKPDALDALAGRIGYFHFKNCCNVDGTYTYSVGLEGGQIDIYTYVQKLGALRYNGPVCIEYVGAGAPHEIVKKDIHYLRECMRRAQR